MKIGDKFDRVVTDGHAWQVGVDGVETITVVEINGQMAPVPWFQVLYAEQVFTVMVNAASVVFALEAR